MLRKRIPRSRSHPLTHAENAYFFLRHRGKLAIKNPEAERAALEQTIARDKRTLANPLPSLNRNEINAFERELKVRRLHSLMLKAKLDRTPFTWGSKNLYANAFDERLARENLEIGGRKISDEEARREYVEFLYREVLEKEVLALEEQILKSLEKISNYPNHK